MEAIIASDNPERALVPQGAEFEQEDDKSAYSSSSEEENEEDLPPGPVDPEKCTVGGPGTAGGSAQAPVSFHIQARDSRDKKLTEGGDYVVVRVIPGSTAKAAGAKESEAIVKDNGDGSYTATYSVDARGDYQLTVSINGSAFGGSPFPVFFSPPDERALEAAFTDALGAVVDPSTISAAAEVPMPVISIMGSSAYKSKVKFPEDRAVLERTVIIGEMNPAVTLEQLQKLFSYSGQVEDCIFSGAKNEFAFVTFRSSQEAEQALTLDKLLVIDRQIRVELAQTALDSKGQSGGTQYAALQLQQIQQLKKAQSEQHSLAAQVASMRVQAKQNPAAFAPGLPQNSASQKAAALSAIAALSRRLAGGAHNPPPSIKERDSGPPPNKRRREVSPTLRYRKDRRSRSRSPPRRRMSPPRRRSPVLILRRSPGRRRRSIERRRDSSRDRRRDSSRDRRRDRSRERRARSRSPNRHRHTRTSSRRNRDRDRDDLDRRTRSRSPQGRKGRHQEDQERKQRRSVDSANTADLNDLPLKNLESQEGSPARADIPQASHKGGDVAQDTIASDANDYKGEGAKAAHIEVGPASENGTTFRGNDNEAQKLREKALEALHSLKSMGSNEDEADAVALPEGTTEEDGKRRRHKSKHHKRGKSKREKRSKRDEEIKPREAVADETGAVELPDVDPQDPQFSP